MVGFDPERKDKSSLLCGFCGSLSGFITRVLIQPLDVVKIRFQLQIEPTSKASSMGKYSGIWQAFKLVVKEEGVTALWKGHVPAQALSVVYGYVQFTAFEHLTRAVWRLSPSSQSPKWKPVTHFVCGGISGCLASAAAQPLDVVRTRLVAQGEPKIYESIHQAAHRMYSLEGTRAFYRGLVPTLVQIFPYAGLQFGFYAFFKALWDISFKVKKHESYQPADFGESLVCGALSGICSKAIVYPFDMVKKRLQIQGFGEARKGFGQFQEYNGLIHCIEVIFKTEGMKGFFKGLAPSTVKASFSVALIFSTYEQCLSLFRNFVETDEVSVRNSATSR